MKLYGNATNVGEKLISSFKNGEAPKALAHLFLEFHGERNCSGWSWTNRLLTYLQGYTDARTYNGWKEVGRQVRKGEKSFLIFEPIRKKIESEDGDPFYQVVGFRAGTRFGIEQTDGDPLAEETAEEMKFLESLPFKELAQKQGIQVSTYNGAGASAAGYFSHDGRIGLGVANLSTWAHELVHWADNELGNLSEKGQHWRSETVAELGGCILLHLTGYHEEADDGGAWSYISKYAELNEIDPVDACTRMLNRTCDAVQHIIHNLGEQEHVGNDEV